MVSLDDKVNLEITVTTLSILLAGLYVAYTYVDINAIPSSLFIEVAEKLVPYLEQWDYSKISFEDWIRTNLIIAPREMFTQSELDELSRTSIYFERELGNATLIVSGDISE